MISILNTRADKHNSCEDSVFVLEDEHYINGIISDGCSSGKNSHFASQAFCYAFAEVSKTGCLTHDEVIKAAKLRILATCTALGLQPDPHLLATCILFDYDKVNKILKIRIFGDGYYYINDVEHVIDQNNIPNYMGYHLYDSPVTFDNYLKKFPEEIYESVDKFMICSDGITRIERSAFQRDATIDPNKLLFKAPNNKTYLQRMWNLIRRDGFGLSDDLTIVSYVS
jgi:hypothetical protein